MSLQVVQSNFPCTAACPAVPLVPLLRTLVLKLVFAEFTTEPVNSLTESPATLLGTPVDQTASQPIRRQRMKMATRTKPEPDQNLNPTRFLDLHTSLQSAGLHPAENLQDVVDPQVLVDRVQLGRSKVAPTKSLVGGGRT